MSPLGLSWLQTLVATGVASLLVAAVSSVCVWCWRKCCINRDAEEVPSNADMRQNLKMKRLCCIDASLYSRAEEGRSNLLHGDTIRSESVPQGPEGSPLTEQEQDKDSTGQGAVEPNHLEAVGRPRSIGHSVPEFELQDLQGQNDIKPEGSLEEVQDPDGSSGTQLEQDGQSGQKVLPFAKNDEHSEGLRQRSWVAPRLQLHSWVAPQLQLRSWVATRLRLRYWVAPQPLATQLGH